MSDTSKRELIEAARLAYVEAWEAARSAPVASMAPHGTKSRAGIRAALAVFEQAHTPTDDERTRVLSILADMDYNDGGMMRWSSGRPTEQAEKVADRIVRELRRGAEQEPNSYPRHRAGTDRETTKTEGNER